MDDYDDLICIMTLVYRASMTWIMMCMVIRGYDLIG